MRVNKDNVIFLLKKHEQKIVFLFIGIGISIFLIISEALEFTTISGYLNEIADGVLPIKIIFAMAGLLLLMGTLMFVLNVNNMSFKWLYLLTKPLLNTFNEFCNAFIYSMTGIFLTSYVYYKLVMPDFILNSGVLLGSVLLIFSFNKFIDNYIHGSANLKEDFREMRWTGFWLIAFMLLSFSCNLYVRYYQS